MRVLDNRSLSYMMMIQPMIPSLSSRMEQAVVVECTVVGREQVEAVVVVDRLGIEFEVVVVDKMDIGFVVVVVDKLGNELEVVVVDIELVVVVAGIVEVVVEVGMKFVVVAELRQFDRMAMRLEEGIVGMELDIVGLALDIVELALGKQAVELHKRAAVAQSKIHLNCQHKNLSLHLSLPCGISRTTNDPIVMEAGSLMKTNHCPLN
jgi:hypothetical protein